MIKNIVKMKKKRNNSLILSPSPTLWKINSAKKI